MTPEAWLELAIEGSGGCQLQETQLITSRSMMAKRKHKGTSCEGGREEEGISRRERHHYLGAQRTDMKKGVKLTEQISGAEVNEAEYSGVNSSVTRNESLKDLGVGRENVDNL